MTDNRSSPLTSESRANTPQLAPLVTDAEKLSTIKMLQNCESVMRKISNQSADLADESNLNGGNARENLNHLDPTPYFTQQPGGSSHAASSVISKKAEISHVASSVKPKKKSSKRSSKRESHTEHDKQSMNERLTTSELSIIDQFKQHRVERKKKSHKSSEKTSARHSKKDRQSSRSNLALHRESSKSIIR